MRVPRAGAQMPVCENIISCAQQMYVNATAVSLCFVYAKHTFAAAAPSQPVQTARSVKPSGGLCLGRQ